MWRQPDNLASCESDRASVGTAWNPGQNIEQGALAAAVRAGDAKDLTGEHVEAHVIDGLQRAEGLFQPSGAQQRSGSPFALWLPELGPNVRHAYFFIHGGNWKDPVANLAGDNITRSPFHS